MKTSNLTGATRTIFRAYGRRILDTKTRVWLECRSPAAARKRAAELNVYCKEKK